LKPKPIGLLAVGLTQPVVVGTAWATLLAAKINPATTQIVINFFTFFITSTFQNTNLRVFQPVPFTDACVCAASRQGLRHCH
jgi:hypothetical protein